MKITCQRINAIDAITHRGSIAVCAELDILPYQIKDLFIQIWNDEGDDSLKEWLNEEGFDMVKRDTLSAKPFTF